ncbi:MAG: hypothetical protein ABSD38_07200 [Syntrophorhabdales bacterium]
MRRVLLGFKRHMVPIPWALFTRLVRQKLRKTAKAFGGLDEDHRRVHHFVVKNLPGLAKPMPPDFIADRLGLSMTQVVRILDELERRLIFLFRPGGREVVWAYPVTVEPTPHRVAFSSGEKLWAA